MSAGSPSFAGETQKPCRASPSSLETMTCPMTWAAGAASLNPNAGEAER